MEEAPEKYMDVDYQATKYWIIELKNGAPKGREEAAFALGSIGDRRAVDPLIAALKDNSTSVRAKAAQALGKIADVHAVDPLITALMDISSSVRILLSVNFSGMIY